MGCLKIYVAKVRQNWSDFVRVEGELVHPGQGDVVPGQVQHLKRHKCPEQTEEAVKYRYTEQSTSYKQRCCKTIN